MTIPHIITAAAISAVIDGESYTITSDNPSYGQVFDAIKNQEAPQTIADLFRTANAIKRYFHQDGVQIDARNGELFFNGEQIHNVVVDRIIAFMQAGLPVTPLVNFLKRLLANPSKRSVEQLYTFLEHKSLPITEDGHFLGYKGVNSNYTDVHSGKFNNSPGKEHKMERRNVCDDSSQGCSYGFHVGSLDYATNWGAHTVIVEVDPADVVSVPLDSNCQKLRTARYRVVCDYQGALNGNLASAKSPYA